MSTNGTKSVIEALAKSALFQDFDRAFSETTGLPVCLQPVDSWQLPHHGHRRENRFCSLMSAKSRSCAVCLQVQQRLAEAAQQEARTVVCFAGLTDTAVPVRLGEHLLGFLQTGQAFRQPPTPAQFERVLETVRSWGVAADEAELRAGYFSAPVFSPKQYEAVVRLLAIFAEHLSMVSNQLLVAQQHAEPPVIRRAKEFIAEHQAEDISLGEVARAVHMSPFYFCKMFKKATGLNFTNYLARVRIERARNLLLNPNLRVSEIAFEVGFQSLTHFNRVFKKIIGQSPTRYRAKLAGNGLPGPRH